jgi:hypothetical protein
VRIADAPADGIRADTDRRAQGVVCLSPARPPLGPFALPPPPRGTPLFFTPVSTDHVPTPTPAARILGVLINAALQSP